MEVDCTKCFYIDAEWAPCTECGGRYYLNLEDYEEDKSNGSTETVGESRSE